MNKLRTIVPKRTIVYKTSFMKDVLNGNAINVILDIKKTSDNELIKSYEFVLKTNNHEIYHLIRNELMNRMKSDEKDIVKTSISKIDKDRDNKQFAWYTAHLIIVCTTIFALNSNSKKFF